MEKVTFDDIVGYEDEKKEARKIVEMIKHLPVIRREGGYLPKGMIIYGKPGVGKTMFAKAIAVESGVPFINVKASELLNVDKTIERFSASFEEAKKQAPSILFWDEIDQLLGERGSSDSDERHHLIDFFLQELDGEDSTTGVFLIATCNDIDSLPSPLLRSGRIDRKLHISLPNDENRLKLLSYYIGKKPIFSEVDLPSLVTASDGLECADFKSITNAILIDCILENRKPTNEDFNKQINLLVKKDIERVYPGPFSKVEAYHELGHFAISYHFGFKSATINIQECHEGYTSVSWKNDDIWDMEFIKRRIMVSLGGKAAEEVFLGLKSVGCMKDIDDAHEYTEGAIKENATFGFQYVSIDYASSQSMEERREVKQTELLTELYEEDKEILREEKDLVEFLLPHLLKKGCLYNPEVDALIIEYEKNHPSKKEEYISLEKKDTDQKVALQ